MQIGIITAMPEESAALLHCAASWDKQTFGSLTGYCFRHGSHTIVLIQGGMGFDNAARAAETLLANFTPELLISTGFCGAVAPQLQVGDTVVACEYGIAGSTALESVPVPLLPITREFAHQQATAGARTFSSLFVSTPSVMNKNAVARLIPADAPFPIVEMESAAIAIVAVEHNIPYLAIRTVSDPRSEELDFSLDEFCDSQMQLRIPKVLLTILKRPRIIPQLMRLAKNSKTAAASLTTAFSSLLPSLH